MMPYIRILHHIKLVSREAYKISSSSLWSENAINKTIPIKKLPTKLFTLVTHKNIKERPK